LLVWSRIPVALTLFVENFCQGKLSVEFKICLRLGTERVHEKKELEEIGMQERRKVFELTEWLGLFKWQGLRFQATQFLCWRKKKWTLANIWRVENLKHVTYLTNIMFDFPCAILSNVDNSWNRRLSLLYSQRAKRIKWAYALSFWAVLNGGLSKYFFGSLSRNFVWI